MTQGKKGENTSNVSIIECTGECNISPPCFLPCISLRNYHKSLMLHKLFVVRGMGSTMPTLALPATLSSPRTWALIILDISQKQRSKVMFTSSSKVAHLLPQWLWNIQPFLRCGGASWMWHLNTTAKCMQLTYKLIPPSSSSRKKA